MTIALPKPPTLSKSLMTSPCQRRGWYSEHIRDAQGHKIRFPMPAKVIFGAALDAMHLELVWAAKEGKEPDLALAVDKGMERARKKDTTEVIDWSVFEVQLRNAGHLFLIQPEGLAKIPLEGLRFQGVDGAKIEAQDIVGYPDYSWPDGSLMDVKSSGNGKYSDSKFWRYAEMPVYALLTAMQDGTIPPRLIYQVYVRNMKPYWQWIEVTGTAALVSLGRAHAEHWRAILAAEVEATAFDTTFCADCGFRKPIPEVGHVGCAVGMAIPVQEEDLAA